SKFWRSSLSMNHDLGAPASLPARIPPAGMPALPGRHGRFMVPTHVIILEVFPFHEPERGCVVIDQSQHIATSRLLRLVFDTAALQGFMAPTHVIILEVFPFQEPERGCVVLDQPQHIATSRLLRLV